MRARGDCLAMHHFPRIPGHKGGDAVCSKPDGHLDAHEGVVGRNAYCWTNATDPVPDPWDSCLDVDPFTGKPDHDHGDAQHEHGDACEGNCT